MTIKMVAFIKAYIFVFLAVGILISSCTENARPSEIIPGNQTIIHTPVVTQTPLPTSTPYPLNEVRWNVYDPNPQHIWNRLFRQLYQRTTSDGQEYGWDSLDPLLWHDTTYLLEGASYQQTISLLDEFLTTKSEDLVTDTLQRAMFQRDLWAVFDWLSFQSDTYSVQRQELAWRLVQVIRKIALTEDHILALPNNYEGAVKSDTFPIHYQSQTPEKEFLPADLFNPDEWVCVGRMGGPIAMTHTEEIPFLGRSVFLVFIRVPGGRAATLSFLQELNDEQPFSLKLADTEVALVRRAMLINKQGSLTVSPLTESIQIRHYNFVGEDFTSQNFYEFQVDRALLFAGTAGGLRPVTKEFVLFRAHGDVFQRDSGEGQVQILETCVNCHVRDTLPLSILSYSRYRFPLPDQSSPFLNPTTPDLEAQAVITWKQKHQTWQALQILANQLR